MSQTDERPLNAIDHGYLCMAIDDAFNEIGEPPVGVPVPVGYFRGAEDYVVNVLRTHMPSASITWNVQMAPSRTCDMGYFQYVFWVEHLKGIERFLNIARRRHLVEVVPPLTLHPPGTEVRPVNLDVEHYKGELPRYRIYPGESEVAEDMTWPLDIAINRARNFLDAVKTVEYARIEGGGIIMRVPRE